MEIDTFIQLYRDFYKNIEKIKIRRNEEGEREKVKQRIRKDLE